MPAVAAGAAIVGAGISIYGAIKSGNDQAAIDRERQDIAGQQAHEIDQRETINEDIRTQAAYKSKLDFGAAAAASGHEGTGIGSQLEIQRQADLQNALSRREADFQQHMLLTGGALQGELGGMAQEGGYVSALGSAFSLGGRFAGNAATSPNTSPSQGLPPANQPRGY